MLFSVDKLKLPTVKLKSDVYLFMTTTRTFHLICLLALVLGLSACGTTGNPSARALALGLPVVPHALRPNTSANKQIKWKVRVVVINKYTSDLSLTVGSLSLSTEKSTLLL